MYIKLILVVLSVILILVIGGIFAVYKSGFMGKLWNPELKTVVNKVKGSFTQLEYVDEKTGIHLIYNLYVPENYDPNKKYPLVLFIHDKSVCGTNKKATLTQGYGAVIWATKEEQSKHESFVLAPQYKNVIANDNYEIAPEGEETINLLNTVLHEYSIDENRLYITGQSMGAMTAMALNIEYPDLFAASLYVAGQWDAKQMNVLASDNIFYLVSEGDAKASPGMDEFEKVLDATGVNTSKATWDGKWSDVEFDAATGKILQEGNSINLVKFRQGTVLPNGVTSSPVLEHIYTWDIAYRIKGVRDWLFAQVKKE